MFTPVIHNLKV